MLRKVPWDPSGDVVVNQRVTWNRETDSASFRPVHVREIAHEDPIEILIVLLLGMDDLCW